VRRGDGIRDSHLGEIELLVDAVRLLDEPSAPRLADLVSDVDAGAVTRKVERLLEDEAGRFAARADALPPAPVAGPGAASRQARRAP